jgi:hypothetical protein
MRVNTGFTAGLMNWLPRSIEPPADSAVLGWHPEGRMQMKSLLKSLGVAAALAATTLGFAQGAQAGDRWGRRGGGDDAAIAIGAGVLGLALGAAIADRGDRRYYDRRYYNSRRYVTVRDRPGYYYYYDGAPRRYYRDRYYGRPNYYGYRGNRWNRGYARDRWDRGYNRGYGRRYDRGYDRGYARRYDRGYGRRYYRY